MPNRRQPRSIRKSDPAPVRIQDRDRFILEALGKMRFLTTSQISALGFHSRWAAHKRMRKLMDAGLVRVWLRSLNDENVYTLDRAGARAMRAEAPIPRALDGNLFHLLSINQVRIACALSLPSVGGELVRWRSDWELHSGIKINVVPDALFEVRWENAGFQKFALEVDHRSRSTRGFARKVLGYANSGFQSHIVLFVGYDAPWVERYRQTLARTRLAPQVFFTTRGAIDREGFLAPVWQSAATDERYSLRGLSNVPYGKEGCHADFLDAERSSALR
jgi:Replication-relaxation